VICEGSCDTEDWSDDAEHFKMYKNINVKYKYKIYNLNIKI